MNHHQQQKQQQQRYHEQFVLSNHNVDSIHKIMNACAQFESIQGAELTERLLLAFIVHYSHYDEHHGEYMGPTSKMYTIAMNAWGQLQYDSDTTIHNHNSSSTGNVSDRVIPAERASKILSFMWKEYNDSNQMSLQPDIIHYTIIFTALSKARTKEAVHLAQFYLEEAEQQSGVRFLLADDNDIGDDGDDGNDDDETLHSKIIPNLIPDRMCYNTILLQWSQYFKLLQNDDNYNKIHNHHHHKKKYYDPNQVYDKMNEMVEKMIRLGKALNDTQFLPNTNTYNLLLQACQVPNLQDSVAKAEGIMKSMNAHANKHLQSGSLDVDTIRHLEAESVFPDTYTINALMQVYAAAAAAAAATENPDSLDAVAEKARNVFKSLLIGEDIMGAEIAPYVKPNLVTINSYMNVLAKSGSVEASIEAENLLLFLLGNTYRSIGILDNDKVVDRLKRLHLKPDAISFSTVVQGFSNCSELYDTGWRAERIFDLMKNVNNSFTPTLSCYVALFNAWAKQSKLTNDGSKYLEAEKAFIGMEKIGFTLKTDFLNALLSIAALNFGDERLKRDVAFKARTLLQQMIDGTKTKPDVHSFSHVIKAHLGFKEEINKRDALFAIVDTHNALCNCMSCDAIDQTYIQIFKVLQDTIGNDIDSGETLCQQMFQKCCEAGLLNNAVLRIYEKLLTTASLRQLERCKTISDDGLVVSNLPKEWSENRRKGQNQRRNRNQQRREQWKKQ
jgi:hypothetical protein